jgi:cold shock protein
LFIATDIYLWTLNYLKASEQIVIIMVEQQTTVPVTSREDTPVVQEVKDDPVVGKYTGQCKWFNDRLGYGFLTVQKGEKKGVDIFVHHSGIKPLNSNYKTLSKGEYVNFSIIDGENGLQAVDVTGIDGGSLMCDVVPARRNSVTSDAPPVIPVNPVTLPQQPRPNAANYSNGFKRVTYQKAKYNGTSQNADRRA